jgi:hypothetical protein
MSECLAIRLYLPHFSLSATVFFPQNFLFITVENLASVLKLIHLLSNLMKHLKPKLMFSKVITTTMKGVLMFMKYCTNIPQ